MRNEQSMVMAFIRRTQTPEVSNYPGAWPNEKTKKLCIQLIEQEVVKELLPAIESDDFVEMIDGACDGIYVILFLMIKIGIFDLEPFFHEVQRTNMEKFDGPVDPETGKQLKPPGWEAPPIAELLGLLRTSHDLIEQMRSKGFTVDTSRLNELEQSLEEDERERINHTLKTWPIPFQATWDGEKLYEVRENDRDFKVGDRLELMEWNPDTQTYSPRMIIADITYITPGGKFHLPPNLCVLGIKVMKRYGVPPLVKTIPKKV